MEKAKSVVRSVSSIFLGGFASLAAFGLVLSLVWAIAAGSQPVKLAGALVSAALAIFLGGFVVAWFDKSRSLALPAAFGLVFGGFSFAYIMGLEPLVGGLAILSTIAAGAGGLLFRTIGGSRPTASGIDAGQ